MKKNQRNYQQLHQISTATLLEESSHLRIMMHGIIVIVVIIAALIVWAGFSRIEETAVTYGEIIPKGQIQMVQHPEGGIVAKVYVNNGDIVKPGQLLVEMDTIAISAELSQLRAREITLTLDEERLRTFLNHSNADFLKWSDRVIKSKYNTVKNQQEIMNLLRDEKTLLMSQYTAYNDQKSILDAALAKKEEQLREITSQIQVWQRHVKLLTEEFDMYHKLKQKNYISHRDYLIVVRELNKAKGENVRLKSQMEQVHEEIKEAKFKLEELNSSSKQTAMKELGKVNDLLLETRHKIEKLEDRLNRSRIVAPIGGIVKGVAVFQGNILKPGIPVMDIVPMSNTMLVESKVNPRDIGHLHIGDKVKVKVLTYDFARYGAIMGDLARLSASTFQNKEGQAYYKATINLDNQYVSAGGKKKKLKPGMTVQADIVTGDKTILQYLLKPIHRARDAAFTER